MWTSAVLALVILQVSAEEIIKPESLADVNEGVRRIPLTGLLGDLVVVNPDIQDHEPPFDNDMVTLPLSPPEGHVLKPTLSRKKRTFCKKCGGGGGGYGGGGHGGGGYGGGGYGGGGYGGGCPTCGGGCPGGGCAGGGGGSYSHSSSKSESSSGSWGKR